jgi:hypothetical protein
MFRQSHLLAIFGDTMFQFAKNSCDIISSWAWVEFYQPSFFPQLIGGFNMFQL